ncbi:MAG: S-layer homology domain-containing protein [Oscillospiraceae bacterium]|nr:S-layer homology domain-containing protein [Oscillospiraceae bacterium]
MKNFTRWIACFAASMVLCGASVLAVEEMPEQETQEVPASSYADISETDSFYDAVQYVSENGLMSGVGGGRFAPDAHTDRATLAVVLWRLAGEPVVNYAMRFSDVAEDMWYTEAVRWAASCGIVTGYDDVTFAPRDVLTREQLCTMIYRYEQYMGGGFSGAWMFLLAYPDAAEISEWAYEAVCWLSMHQVTAPTDAPLLPKGGVPRGELAQMLALYAQIASR